MAQSTYNVTGMTCQHCVNSVTEELKTVGGVTGVEVFLVSGGASTVQVTSDDELARADVQAAVEEAGYQLV